MRKRLFCGAVVGLLLAATGSAQAVLLESEPNDAVFPINSAVAGTNEADVVSGLPVAGYWSDVGLMTLGGANDVDFFALELKAGQILTAITTPIEVMFTQPDTYIGLFDAAGVMLAADDNSSNDSGGLTSYGSAVQAPITEDGIYYLGITGTGDTGFEGTHQQGGMYALTVSVIPIPEPAGVLFLLAGSALLIGRGRRR